MLSALAVRPWAIKLRPEMQARTTDMPSRDAAIDMFARIRQALDIDFVESTWWQSQMRWSNPDCRDMINTTINQTSLGKGTCTYLVPPWSPDRSSLGHRMRPVIIRGLTCYSF